MERTKQIRHAGDAAEKIADKNIRRALLIETVIAQRDRSPRSSGIVFSASSTEILSAPPETTPQTFS